MTFPDKASKASKTTLFTLPRELRDIIYEDACDEVEVTIRPGHDNKPRRHARLSPYANIGILTTCTQMRAEAQKIYYPKTLFAFTDIMSLAIWLRAQVPPALLGSIKTLRLACGRIKQLPIVIAYARRHVHQPGLCNLQIGFYQSFRKDAKAKLEEAKVSLNKMLGTNMLAILHPEAIQVPVVNGKFEVVWTCEPDAVPLPTYDDLVKFVGKKG
ncbi:hypothetical protein M409DRAFT_23697 [Zasmidium cellare ATCC 36951]|uniref:Uncharacterized protein n=1 Tax=Zasmidium cellare ATCC 36951 TaxID=1080233 RepID=A0A6A6CIE6_ZASCE|nr:uncharacterized protein M409DRAFT_23697 [Zasmidium cellare ATCC 36951]KAF2165970.1 hypothetical protein M409DRAFT_23697 [Zasmidium cellare ATCC 36951]